jgi:GT2 family glycosyltransferase
VSETAPARLSVVVVTYKSAAALERSLPPLVAQLREMDELIVVDNASADGSLSAVRRLAPAARVIENADNAGFAAAANQGAEVATGDVILLLNPDAVVSEGFRDAIVRPYGEWAAWLGLVTMDSAGAVNTSGTVVHFTGVSGAGQAGEPLSAAPRGRSEVTGASGACLAVRTDAWRRHGGFSPDFFMYCEDTDLSLRLRLAGERVGIEPAARVDHDYDFAKGAAKWRLLERNRWAMVLRTYPPALLALVAPALLATEVALFAVSLAGGWFRQKLLADLDVARSLPRLLRERRAIQAHRSVTAREFARALTADLSSQYLGRAGRSRVLRLGLRAYWRVVWALLR